MTRCVGLLRAALVFAAMLLLSACFTSNSSLIATSRAFTPISPGTYCEYSFNTHRADWGACTRINLARLNQNEYSYYRAPSSGTAQGTRYTVRILNTALTRGSFSGDYPAQACTQTSCYLGVARVFSSSEMQMLIPNCSTTQNGACTLYSVSDMISRFGAASGVAARYKFVRVGG